MRPQRVLIYLCVALLCAGAACSQRGKQPAKKKAPATKPTGTVKVTSDPGGAAVLLRGNHRLGHTPLTLTRPDATGMKLVLVKDGYQKETFFVMVEGGKNKVEHHKLYPKQGRIDVRAGPFRGGKIMIDGKYVGRIPNSTDVKADVEHLVEVTMDRFHPYSERVSVKAGMAVTVNAMMIPANRKAPKLGWIALETDTPAMVYLNGTFIGATPMAKLPVPAKKHALRVASKALRKEKKVSVEVKAGEVKKLRVELKQ